MSKKSTTCKFFFSENSTHYVLSGSFGTDVWLKWKKDLLSKDAALERADCAIGQYVREHNPTNITYVIEINENGRRNSGEMDGARYQEN